MRAPYTSVVVCSGGTIPGVKAYRATVVLCGHTFRACASWLAFLQCATSLQRLCRYTEGEASLAHASHAVWTAPRPSVSVYPEVCVALLSGQGDMARSPQSVHSCE